MVEVVDTVRKNTPAVLAEPPSTLDEARTDLLGVGGPHPRDAPRTLCRFPVAPFTVRLVPVPGPPDVKIRHGKLQLALRADFGQRGLFNVVHKNRHSEDHFR